MSHAADSVLCEYEATGENEHTFTFLEGNRDAVRQWADHIEAIQLERKWYNTGELYLLIDARQAVDLPIRTMFEVLSDYNRAYPQLKPPTIKLALVHHPETIILEIYHMFAELLDPPVTVQYFTNFDEAKAWLQQGR